MKRLLSISLVAVILLTYLAVLIPVQAQPQDLVLKGGYVATVIGKTADGKNIYQARFGLPQYCDDLKTKIDTKWYLQSDGSYKSGSNKYSSTVVNEQITVSYDKEYSKWTPEIRLVDSAKGTNTKLNTINVKPTLLDTDPLNPNYSKNTLVWHYANGVDRYMRLVEGQCQEYFIINQPLDTDFVITPSIAQTNNYKGYNKANAVDLFGEPIKLIEDSSKKVTLKASSSKPSKVTNGMTLEMAKLYEKEVKQSQGNDKKSGKDPEVQYPIIIDPNQTFISSASDGYIYTSNAVYNNVWTSNTGTVVDATAQAIVGQSPAWMGTNFVIFREYLFFDTSGIPLASTVTSADLSLHFTNTYGFSVNYDITLTDGTSTTYPHDPLVAGDYDKANYNVVDGGHINTSAISNAYHTIALNAAGIAMIQNGSDTKFCIRSSKDIAGTAPTVNESMVAFYPNEQGVGYYPYLDVTFTATTPAITAVAASAIANTSAQLNSTITDDGADTANCSVEFGWGTTSQTKANYAAYTNHTAATPASGYSVGENPYVVLTGLTANTTYYFRAKVTNSSTSDVSANEITFTTANDLAYVTNFNGIPSTTSISLNWAKASGSSNTYIYQQIVPYDNTTPILIDGTGTATGSPVTILVGANTIAVTGAGTFNVVGVLGTVVSDTATVTGSPVTLSGGNDLIDTGATTGNITINATGFNPNPYLMYNPSFETSDPPAGWTLTGAGATVARSGAQKKIGSYSAAVTRNGANATLYQGYSNYAALVGQEVIAGGWVYNPTLKTCHVSITDGVNTVASADLSATSTWEYLTASMVVDGGATQLRAQFVVDTADSTGYVDGLTIIQGTAIPAMGTLIYSGTGSSYNNTSLTSGKTYYYQAFGYSSGVYSSVVAPLSITTLGTASTLVALPTPVLPPEVFQPVDTSALSPFSNLEPIYSLVKNAAESMDMPMETLSAGLALFIIAIVGLLILIGARSVSGALFTMCVLMGLCVPMKILPWEFIGLIIPMGLGAWATARGEGNNV